MTLERMQWRRRRGSASLRRWRMTMAWDHTAVWEVLHHATHGYLQGHCCKVGDTHPPWPVGPLHPPAAHAAKHPQRCRKGIPSRPAAVPPSPAGPCLWARLAAQQPRPQKVEEEERLVERCTQHCPRPAEPQGKEVRGALLAELQVENPAGHGHWKAGILCSACCWCGGWRHGGGVC